MSDVKRYSPFPDSAPDGWPLNYVDEADYDSLCAEIDGLKKDAERWKKAYFDTCAVLENFHAMVKGESPSLLEDDCNAIAAEAAIRAAIQQVQP